jgi:Rrf2 family iron-sulfur cluster assembly transcriptional regulator
MITRTGVHALKAMAALGGLQRDGYAGAALIASKIRAPRNYLGKLLGKLSRAGLVEGRKGAGGGFRLSRSASEITLFDVLRHIEDLDRLQNCFMGGSKCPDRSPCALHSDWSKIRDRYMEFLKSIKLRSLFDERRT